MRGETELIATDLAGKRERNTFDVADKERAVLEAFADAVTAGVKFLDSAARDRQQCRGAEALTASAKSGKSVQIL